MKLNRTLKFTKYAFLLAAFAAPVAKADTFNFHLDINVANLVGAPNGPFYLDFQLNEGNGTTPSNTITLSGFTFTGGSAAGSATVLNGTASGNFGSSIILSDSSSSQFNEIFQGFSSGTTDIQFNVSISQNSFAVAPDNFLVTILDNENPNQPIFTDAPDTLSLVSVNLSSANTLADVDTYSSTDPTPTGVTATATAVPEPTSLMALLGGAGVLWSFRRSRAAAR